MTAILLSTLFTAIALFAVASIAASVRRYGPAALLIARQSRPCPQSRDVRWSVRKTEVRTAGATILRPEFGVRAAARPPRPALRAAA